MDLASFSKSGRVALAVCLSLALVACEGAWPGDPPKSTLYLPSVSQNTSSGEVAQTTALAARNAVRIAALDEALVGVNARLGGQGAEPAVEIAALRTANSTLSDEISALNIRISELEASIQSLSASLDRMGQSVSESVAQTSKVRNLINQKELDTLDEGGHELHVGDGQVYAVHLASYRSGAKALEGWKDLQARYPALLGGLSARLAPLDLANAGGSYLRLLAGPFEDIPPARTLCDKLKHMDMFCQLSLFSGDALH